MTKIVFLAFFLIFGLFPQHGTADGTHDLVKFCETIPDIYWNLFFPNPYHETCGCGSTSYYDGTSCVPLKTYQQICTNSYECASHLGLGCINGKCDCTCECKCSNCSAYVHWMPAIGSCKRLLPSCKAIKTADSSVPSGVYYLASSAGALEAYCEMVIDGGGYTFLPWASLNAAPSILNIVYNDTSRVLFRLRSKSNLNSQPYVLTTQHPNFVSYPISVQLSAHVNYGTSGIPLNSAIGPYIFIGMVPAAQSNTSGSILGYRANGQTVQFTNCDGNPNSYWALFANLNPASPSTYCSNCDGGGTAPWRTNALAHPLGTYMPNNYFYFAEMHWGGCGGYVQSNYWASYYGVSVGFR